MDITEEIKKLLGDLGLSEDMVTRLKVMVEKAVHERSETIITNLQEELEFVKEKAEEYAAMISEKAQEYGDMIAEEKDAEIDSLKESAQAYGDYITEELATKIEGYADYVVEKFITDNRKQLVESQEYARMLAVFSEIKEAFESKAFLISENDSQVSELNKKLNETTTAYNTLFEEHVAMKNRLAGLEQESLFESLTSTLADTQRDKVKRIINTMTFASRDEYKRAVELMIEEVIQQVPEIKEEKVEPSKAQNSLMEQYLNRL